MNYNRQKREKWYKEWVYYPIWKKIPTFKTTSITNMEYYFKYVIPNLNTFFKFHIDKNFRGINFNAYCMNKKVMHQLCMNITKGKKNMLIGFGDFSQKDRLGSGTVSAPIQKLKVNLKKYCSVIEIDEYKTSKTCNKCHKEICLYRNRLKKNKDAKSKLRTIYSVIRCKNNECSLSCMNRDINASKNILELLLCEKENKERPKCFSRQKDEPKTLIKDKRKIVKRKSQINSLVVKADVTFEHKP